MFLSFVIPIYNCEQYIKKNLDIILGSGLTPFEYEVILVNDGSRDGSAAICNRYAEKFSNVKYVCQRNQGPATARNTGLEHVKGDYIWFVDADDSINPEILPKLKSIVDGNDEIDLISFGYVSQYPDGDRITKEVEKEFFCSGLEYLRMPRHGSYLWNNIYRRAAIGNKRMLDGVSHIEDTCFNVQTVINFSKVVVLPDIGYYYNRCNVNSISNNKFLRDRVKANADSFFVYQTLFREMKQTMNAGHRKFLMEELNFSINAHIYTMFKFDNVRTVKKYISRYKAMGLYPLAATGNKKGDMFRMVANRPWLMYMLMRLSRCQLWVKWC